MAKRQLGPREGKNKTGHRLNFSCAFCGSRFRSRRQRTSHTNGCKERKPTKPNRRRRTAYRGKAQNKQR